MRVHAALAVALAILLTTIYAEPNATTSCPTPPSYPTPPTSTGSSRPLHTARTYETPHFTFARLYNLTARFFDAFLYPSNIQQSTSINSTLFAPNVLGRVDVSRTFNGRELNTEYVFGLFSALQQNPRFFSLLGLPLSYNFTHFAANQNIVSVAAVAEFEVVALGVRAPIELDIWMTYNRDGEISQYDATFRWLDWQFNWLLGVGQAALGVNSTAAVVEKVTLLLATSICETAQLHCNGTNVQYESAAACYTYLTEEIRFGSSYQLGMNTLLCRMIHQVMVRSRPDVHCSHIGPSGGAYCVDDLTYAGVVTEPIFANSPFVPYGYQNKNETIAEM